jgi:hypothetical protein
MQLCWIPSLVLIVFWWSLWGFLYIRSCHLQTLTLWFIFQFRLLLFLSLVWLLWLTSSSILKKSGYPCLVPDPRENVFIFSPFTMMLVIGLLYMSYYYVEVHSSFI